jgi:hypothetical protein
MALINLGGSISTTGAPILGAYSVVFSSNANHTLSVAEYTNKFLSVTSSLSLTGEWSLLAPMVQGQEFVIQNNTTGGQAIQIIGVSDTGGSVTIPNGATVAVVCDGTNYLAASGGASGSGLPNLPADGYWELAVEGGVGSWKTAGGGGGSVDATAVTYEPGTPGNWTSPPTQVAEALDDLAAIVVVPPDASAVTYEPETPSDWSTPPTQVAGALDDLASIVGELATPSILVYDPTGSQEGSYTTFTALCNAASAAHIEYAIIYMNGNPEAGNYELPTSCELVINGTIAMGGATIAPTPFRIRGNGNPKITATGLLFGYTSGDIVLDGVTIVGSGSLGVFKPEGLHLGSCTITMINGASVGDGTNPIFGFLGGDFTYTINVYQQSTIEANSLYAAHFTVNYDAGSTVSTTQPNAGTLTLNPLTNPAFIVFFTPGGTESGNTYTSWADLVAAIASLSYVEIHTAVGGEIPSGSYTMPTAWSIIFDQYADITIDDGVSFSTTPTSILAPEGGAILSNCVSGSPFPNSSGSITINNVQFAFTGSGTPSPVFTYPSSTYPDMFWINSGSDGVLPVFSTTTGALLCSGSEGYLPANTITLTGGWSLYPDPGFGSANSNPIDTSFYSRIIICGIYVDRTGSGITTIPPSSSFAQSLLMDNTTGILYYSNSSSLGSVWTPLTGGGASYTPGDPSKWSGSPTTMQQAIDRIAAVVGASTPIP